MIISYIVGLDPASELFVYCLIRQLVESLRRFAESCLRLPPIPFIEYASGKGFLGND